MLAQRNVVRLPRAQALPRAALRPVALGRLPVPLIRAQRGGLAEGSRNDSESSERREAQPLSPLLAAPGVVCAKGGGGGGGMGSNSSLGAVMEKSRLEFVMPTPTVQGPKLDDGGDGGDIGKINHNGGGGDDGGGDDDDYFDGEGDGDGDGEGEGAAGFFWRTLIPESYDKFSIAAVFSEWMKTVADLPLILRRAVEMGLFSSAQLVRFFSMDVRPNVTRTISRTLPPAWAREFVGRLMADPAFVQKMVIESTFAACASLWYEYRARGGENFKKELDLVMINTLGMAAATGASVWLVAPTRSYGTVHKFPWQQMLDGLPNCVFDASGPLRQYTQGARAAGFFAKMAELSAVGAVMGTCTSLLGSAAVAVRRKADPSWEPSVAVPDLARSSGGLAAFFALNANIRYQILGGFDRYLFERCTHLWLAMGLSGAARVSALQVGELSRPWWQGLPHGSALRSALPQRRRVTKKVSKKVPKLRTAAAQADLPLEAAALAVGTSAATAAMPFDAMVQPLEVGEVSTSYPAADAMSSSVSALEADQHQAGASMSYAAQSVAAAAAGSQQLLYSSAAADGGAFAALEQQQQQRGAASSSSGEGLGAGYGSGRL